MKSHCINVRTEIVSALVTLYVWACPAFGQQAPAGDNSNPNLVTSAALYVKPLGDRVLVEPVTEAKQERNQWEPALGVVVALGTGKTDDDGKKIPFEVKVGDQVLVDLTAGVPIVRNGKSYFFISSTAIVFVVDDSAKPLGDRVLVEPVAEAKQQQNQSEPTVAIVVALGTGKLDANGKRIPFEVKVGDKVLVNAGCSCQLDLEGKHYLVPPADDLVAVLE